MIPWAALAAGALALAALVSGLRRRPVLAGAAVLAAAPAFYVGLVWAGVLAETFVRFARPAVTLVAWAAMAFCALRLAGQPTRGGRARTLAADVLTGAAVLAAAIAAAGPELGRPLDRLTVILVVDRSRSIDLVPNADKRIELELGLAERSMREHDLVGRVVFAASAEAEEPPRAREAPPAAQRVELGRDGTDIAAGIRRALADVPADSAGRLVLVSDGVPTRGDVMAAAAAAVAAGVPVDVLPLEQRELPDVRIASFRVTPRAAEGETIDLRVVVASPQEADVELRIKRDGQLVRRVPARVAAGEDVLRLRELAPTAGLHRYDVEITAADPSLDATAEDNAAGAFVRVRGAARALVLDGDPGGTAFVANALAAAGIRVDEGSLSALPADAAGLAAYDLLVFGDIPASELAPARIEAIASYVRDLGGGLFLTGGDRSMGPGGYAGSPLEEVAPVSFDLKQEQRRASLAEVIAIDISGSMAMRVGPHTKLELANEAAARSAELLGPGDSLGVLHVDTQPLWAVPVAPVADKKKIDTAIRSVGPGGGGILVDVALAEAYPAVAAAKVNLKHVLLFADGSDAENITPDVQALVSRYFADGVTLSCVSLGNGPHTGLLEDLSRRGGGRFYIVEDASRLPAVFTQETVLASRSAVVERPFRVGAGARTSIVEGVDFAAAPELRGYVVTIPKGRATVVLGGPEEDPILATWSAGVGRAVAFTSDLKDRWGGAWTSWEGAARLVAQTGRWASRNEDDGRVRLEADATGAQLALRATVVDDDGRLQSFRRLVAVVSGPDGFHREVPLEASAAGAYAATLPLDRPGAYVAVARDEASGDVVATTGAALGTGEELRPTGSDLALLARVAELTGGRKRDSLDGVFSHRVERRFAYRDATAPVLAFAAAALLLMVAARRLAFPGGTGARLRAVLAWRPWSGEEDAPAPGGATAEGTLAHLLASKQRVQREREAAQKEQPAARAAPPVTGSTPTPPPSAEPSAPNDPARAPSSAELLATRRRQAPSEPKSTAPAPVAIAAAPPEPVRNLTDSKVSYHSRPEPMVSDLTDSKVSYHSRPEPMVSDLTDSKVSYSDPGRGDAPPTPGRGDAPPTPRPASAPVASRQPAPTPPRSPKTPETAGDAAARPRTAAEILLEKRRGRRS
jgi:uncharacterized membrane protein